MQQNNPNYLPGVALNFTDLVPVRSIIRAYTTYTRRASQPTRERDEQLRVLEILYLRLNNIPGNLADMAVLLSDTEITALDCALAGFCDFIRKKVPPSRERDETLRDVERLRSALAALLIGR